MPAQAQAVGAGAGATVGKLFGIAHAMKGGIGTASIEANGVRIAALVAVNAVGDVIDPATNARGGRQPPARMAARRGASPPRWPVA